MCAHASRGPTVQQYAHGEPDVHCIRAMGMNSAVLSIISVLAVSGCGDMVVAAGGEAGADPEDARDREDDPDPALADAGADAAKAAAPLRADASTLALVSLTPSTPRITEGEKVTFSATVSDPYGLSDITRAVLTDEQGTSYGNFTTVGSWTYRLTLGWADIHRVRAISFAPPSAKRTFTAIFANRHGQTVTAAVELELHCAPEDHAAACGGACTNLWTQNSCGACARLCVAPQTCDRGTCR